MTQRMPSLFVSHGAPTFALEPGRAGAWLTSLGRQLPRPKAVVVLSPHWMTGGVRVGFSAAPETIHDFGGFPSALYDIRYPAPGQLDVAAQALQLLQTAGFDASADPARGLDHGVWVPLRHLYPHADVPVVPVSMPQSLDAAGAVRLGRALAPVADDGVLIVGSGSITHNLSRFGRRISPADAAYAVDFMDWARAAVHRQDEQALVNYLAAAPQATLAHPSSEHYLPLPFAFGAAGLNRQAQVLDAGMTYDVIGMDAYLFGDFAWQPAVPDES
jgi:4,5-DOPA dioxygenase extradiol